MPKDLSQILVIDLESTCWPRGDEPKDQISEIIEIGLAVLDVKKRECVANESYLIRPVNSKVSVFCNELTTLTQEELDAKGTSLEYALFTMNQKYDIGNKVWASYGDYDRKMFLKECERKRIRYPFRDTHINVKSLYALQMGLSREIGMKEALEQSGLPFYGTHHRGVHDARAILDILMDCLWPK